MAELHQEMLAPLVDALAALGARNPQVTATLIYGLVRSAAAAVSTGTPRTTVTRETLWLIRAGLAGTAVPDPN